MKLYDFLILSDEQQYQAIWEHGTYIDSLLFDKIHHQLYSINDFFIEIYYDALSNNIIGKEPFKQGARLDKYLSKTPLL